MTTETVHTKKQQRKAVPPTPLKPPVPPVRVFKVRRPNVEFPHNRPIEEGIEAHKVETPDCGALVFYRYTEGNINDNGEVFYSYRIEKIIAPGTYYDLVEVTEDFIPHNVS